MWCPMHGGSDCSGVEAHNRSQSGQWNRMKERDIRLLPRPIAGSGEIIQMLRGLGCMMWRGADGRRKNGLRVSRAIPCRTVFRLMCRPPLRRDGGASGPPDGTACVSSLPRTGSTRDDPSGDVRGSFRRRDRRRSTAICQRVITQESGYRRKLRLAGVEREMRRRGVTSGRSLFGRTPGAPSGQRYG